MQVDATLSYNEHVINIKSTCMASLCHINRIKHLLVSRTLENVITSLVFSKLYFCSTVWANSIKTNVRKLQKIQNFAARILTGTRKYEQITPVLNNLRRLSVPAMLALYDAILTFKCLRGLAPKYLSSHFNTRASVHGRNTRWLSVPAMLALYDAILTFKCLRGLAPKYLSSHFNTRASVHGRNTRNKNKLDIIEQ